MRSINLYYVYDNINEVVVSPVIPCVNDLSAAIGFRDVYMTEEAKKKYNYKALDLVRFCVVKISPDGEYYIESYKGFDKIVRLKGDEIIKFIQEEMIKLGIEDNFVEEDN